MMRIHLMSNIEVRYIDCVLKSALTREYYMENATGSAGSMPKINQTIVANNLIPMLNLLRCHRVTSNIKNLAV